MSSVRPTTPGLDPRPTELRDERRAPSGLFRAGRRRWSARDTAVFLAVVGVLAATGLTTVYRRRPELVPIRSDGVGYYAYLPQVLIRHDPHFRTLPPEIARFGPPASFGFAQIPGTERYLDKYQIGEAVALLPFFGLAHVAAVVSGAPRTGFSAPYQVAVAAASVAFLLLG